MLGPSLTGVFTTRGRTNNWRMGGWLRPSSVAAAGPKCGAAARAPLADTGSPGGRAAGAARAVTATQVIVTVYCSCPRPAPICSKKPSYLLYQTCGYTYTILIWTHGPATQQILL